MRIAILAVGMAAVLGSVAYVAADGDEGKVPLDKVPKAVLATVKAKYAEGKILDAELEEESGTKLYTLNVQVGKDKLELKIKPDGKLLRVEQEIAVDKLPEAVKKGFDNEFAGKTIKKAERIEQRGRVLYEIEYYLSGKSGQDKEVVFTGEGKLASVEEGAEVEVPVAKLPKKVVAAVKAKFPKGEPSKAEMEKLDREVVYKVIVKDQGHDVEVTLNAEGKIFEIEKAVAAKDLPQVVAAALEAKYPKADIQKVEATLKENQETYRVTLVTAEKKKFEVKVDATGKILIEEPKK